MDFLEWATSPWGQSVPIHIALVSDLGCNDRGVALPDRSRHLRHVLRQAESFHGRRFFRAFRPAYPSAFPGTRWSHGCFTGSWQPPCSRCCLPPSFQRWVSSFPG